MDGRHGLELTSDAPTQRAVHRLAVGRRSVDHAVVLHEPRRRHGDEVRLEVYPPDAAELVVDRLSANWGGATQALEVWAGRPLTQIWPRPVGASGLPAISVMTPFCRRAFIPHMQ